jgi:S1-C subfamily serine protease
MQVVMTIRTTCQACGFVFQVKGEFAGIKAKCSECGAVVQVPKASPDTTVKPSAAAPVAAAAPKVAKAAPKVAKAVPTARKAGPKTPKAAPKAAPSAPKPRVVSDSAPAIDLFAAAPPEKAVPPQKAALPAVRPKESDSLAARKKGSAPAAPSPGIALQINTGDDESSVASRSAGHAGQARRKAPKTNNTLLAIIAVLAIALVGAAGVGALYMSGVLGGGEDAVADQDGENWETKTPGENPSGPANGNNPTGENTETRGNDTDKGPIEYDNGFGLEESLYVREIKDVARAVVKFEIPNKEGTGGKTGTGFFIDKRGWVATNYHVIDGMTTDARAKMKNGDSYEIAGVIAQVKERDLAIVKLADKPFQPVLLDIDSYMKEPEDGDEIYSFGHPYTNEFALTKGIVSRVMTTGDLSRNQPGHLLTTINAPSNQVWIQHDSKINPGNSGGPVFNEKCQVIGVNSFQDRAAGFGFASHVRHLREIVKAATDSVTPLPEGRGGGTLTAAEVPNLTGSEMEKIFDECKGFSWTPQNADQYAKMAKLAGSLATAAGDVDQVATTLFGTLKEATWTDDQINAINKFAAGQVDKVNQGIILAGQIKQLTRSEFGSVFVLEVKGIEKLVVVENVPSDVSDAQQDDKVLLLGLVSPRTQPAARTGDKVIFARWINSRHMKKL